MKLKFAEYKSFDLSKINQEVLKRWKKDATFNKSLDKNKDNETFVFYEGPPSANGMPGIHHVMARTIKDVFCRYKTQQGYLVRRKAGWDTHGLPVELGVEKQLGITKEDIGKSVSVAEYNEKCREEVMKFTDAWEDLTEKMGYWINMDDPYITYDNRYIESVWNLLKKLFEKGLLYKGYTIQPYSPAAGTGLSTHELNQPGCYRDVKDTSCVAQFKMIPDEKSQSLISQTDTDIFFLAWTTTPWTLPSNTALAVGDDIKYAMVRTFNPYTGLPVTVILARDLVNVYFPDKNKDLTFDDYQPGDKKVPFKILKEFKGSEFVGIKYEQLIDWVKPDGDAFRIIQGDFVTTEEGTGIVHIAPTFGADDYRVAQQHDIVPLVIEDANGQKMPLVDKQGRFMPVDEMASDFVERFVNVDSYQSFQGRFVKNEYDDNLPDDAPAIDVDIAVMLKKENKAFRVEKYVHSYPH
ncbi:MAG: class I tRNA ligase family protein, partial [Bacteroidota bacterium]